MGEITSSTELNVVWDRRGMARVGVALAGVVLLGACASAPPAEEAARPVEAPAGPLPGTNYLIYAADDSGLWRRDTRVGGADSLVVPAFDRLLQAIVSPDRDRLAVALRRGDTSEVLLIDAASGGARAIHAGRGDGTYTLGWTADGQRLGVGYQPGARDPEGGAVLVVERDGSPVNAGCSVSNRFAAWRSDGTMVVSEGRNLYTVRATDCATLATLPMTGKSDFAFSADGARVAFNRTTGMDAGLTVSATNGADARRIADPQFLPRNAQWSPTGRHLAFEIRSRQYANVTHVAVHDFTTNRVRFAADETALGLPTDANPCWSPNGTWLAHDRRYARSSGDQAYTMHQKVVTSVPDGAERIVSEELVGERVAAAGGAADCVWADDDYLLVSSPGGAKVVRVDGETSYDVRGSRRVVFVRVFR